jgi:hypothetical protein
MNALSQPRVLMRCQAGPFGTLAEAHDYHPAANIEKMRRYIPRKTRTAAARSTPCGTIPD